MFVLVINVIRKRLFFLLYLIKVKSIVELVIGELQRYFYLKFIPVNYKVVDLGICHPPSYSAKELKRWILLNPLFRPLYISWLKSGYKTELAPSVDRLNDYLPYTLDNIQLMTWAENKLKGERETKEGKKYNKVKSVVCLEKDTEKFINQYYSYHEAMRDTSIKFNTIASAVSKNIESNGAKNYLAGGYYWCGTLVYMNYMLQDIENTERSVKTDKIEYSNIIFDEETSTVSINAI